MQTSIRLSFIRQRSQCSSKHRFCPFPCVTLLKKVHVVLLATRDHSFCLCLNMIFNGYVSIRRELSAKAIGLLIRASCNLQSCPGHHHQKMYSVILTTNCIALLCSICQLHLFKKLASIEYYPMRNCYYYFLVLCADSVFIVSKLNVCFSALVGRLSGGVYSNEAL